MNAKLTDAERERIFERLIVPNTIRGTSPVRGCPKAIMIAGAPGSGEGELTAAARKQLAGPPGGHVEIEIDSCAGITRGTNPSSAPTIAPQRRTHESAFRRGRWLTPFQTAFPPPR